MTDDEWEKLRARAISTEFETGRPVFDDTDGVLRFSDGAREEVPDDVDVAVSEQTVPRATALALRAERSSRFAFVMSVVAAGANAVRAIWHPWQLALVPVFVFSALVWRRVNGHQRTAMGRGATR